MNKIIRLETFTEDGQQVFVDINMNNFTFTKEYNGNAEIHFSGGETLEVESGVWEMMKNEWSKNESDN